MSDRPTADDLRNVKCQEPDCGHATWWHGEGDEDYCWADGCECQRGWAHVLAAAWPAPVVAADEFAAALWADIRKDVASALGVGAGTGEFAAWIHEALSTRATHAAREALLRAAEEADAIEGGEPVSEWLRDRADRIGGEQG